MYTKATLTVDGREFVLTLLASVFDLSEDYSIQSRTQRGDLQVQKEHLPICVALANLSMMKI